MSDESVVMAPRGQYVAIKFEADDFRSYTYHNRGPRMEVGMRGEVVVRGARRIVEVCEVDVEPPQGMRIREIVRVEDQAGV